MKSVSLTNFDSHNLTVIRQGQADGPQAGKSLPQNLQRITPSETPIQRHLDDVFGRKQSQEQTMFLSITPKTMLEDLPPVAMRRLMEKSAEDLEQLAEDYLERGEGQNKGNDQQEQNEDQQDEEAEIFKRAANVVRTILEQLDEINALRGSIHIA